MMSLSVYVHNNERYRHCCYCTCLYNSWFVTSTTSAVTSVVGTIVVVGSQQWSAVVYLSVAVHGFRKYVLYVDSSSGGSRWTKQPTNCWQVYYTRGHPCTPRVPTLSRPRSPEAVLETYSLREFTIFGLKLMFIFLHMFI